MQGEDGIITLPLNPPTPAGGWTTRFDLMKRAGGSPFYSLYGASGYQAGQSGVTLVNSGQGVFSFPIPSNVTSGINPTNYAYRYRRLDSGFVDVLTLGFLQLTTS